MSLHAPCPERAKKVLLAGLLACFLVQAGLVYSDPPPGQPLSGLALEGRRVWHRNNCQACHQLHGFGGFLGPDLTNARPRLSQWRLDTILTEGYGQMPAFHLPPEEIAAIAEFLAAMDGTGRGQALAPQPPSGAATFAWSDLPWWEYPR